MPIATVNIFPMKIPKNIFGFTAAKDPKRALGSGSVNKKKMTTVPKNQKYL